MLLSFLFFVVRCFFLIQSISTGLFYMDLRATTAGTSCVIMDAVVTAVNTPDLSPYSDLPPKNGASCFVLELDPFSQPPFASQRTRAAHRFARKENGADHFPAAALTDVVNWCRLCLLYGVLSDSICLRRTEIGDRLPGWEIGLRARRRKMRFHDQFLSI